MKWESVVLVCYGLNDSINHSSASGWKERYKIPTERCFYFNEEEYQFVNYYGFTPGRQACLAGIVTSTTKVIIIGHGCSRLAAGYPVDRFARKMREIGADKAGLLAIKCCGVGQADFLERLKILLPEVGWFIAPKGYSSTQIHKGIAHDVITFNFDFTDLDMHKKGRKLSDKHRVKVVKGLGNASPVGSSKRYGTKKGGCVLM
ncbi:MAG TPA: hypothetical protein DHV72_00520 [Serratia grimesii]|uniref:Uncharacterized protein n=1 Tax=Serratia grimesii TaxID=82995 RepID=A0A9C7V5R6_9GAMM|nr:hypothetical protein [Serratia grimesii]HCJ98501.1 hypothetical protein [Serratia grimesii]